MRFTLALDYLYNILHPPVLITQFIQRHATHWAAKESGLDSQFMQEDLSSFTLSKMGLEVHEALLSK
jgi:hypothetical protein